MGSWITVNTPTIVYCLQNPLTARDKKRFGLEELKKSGFSVQAWDLSAVVNPAGKIDEPIEPGVRIFTEMGDVSAALAELPEEAWLIVLTGYNARSLGLYREISRRKLRYVIDLRAGIPSMQPQDVVGKTFFRLKRLKKFTPWRFFNSLMVRIPYGWLGVRPADMVLGAGSSLVRDRYPISEASRIVWMHSQDYDRFLEAKDAGKNGNQDKPIAVFLDEYRPFHPDYAFDGEPSVVSPEAYYGALCRIFERVEKDLGLEVVVAAHPRARYEDHPDYFQGRRIVHGTLEWVLRSSLVLAHSSTSVSFAVLSQKPVVVVTTNEMAASHEGPLVDYIAEALGTAPLNLDALPESLDWKTLRRVDEQSYKTYKNRFLKHPESPEKPSWAVVGDRLKML